jgi:type I restriction-modification system DNA methylase subunit
VGERKVKKVMGEGYIQLSLFDAVETEAEPKAEAEAETKRRTFKPALVPDEEFSKIPYINVPKVDEIIKLISRATYKVGIHELLTDVFECSAIAISNKFDMRNYNSREEKYKAIMKKYDADTRNLICEIFAKIYVLLSSQIVVGFNDYLGELYMRSETSSSKAGQFFTPYCVSKMCAEVSINQQTIDECIEKDKILTMHEPTVGAGGMVLALADVLYNKFHFNIARNLFVECGDIDTRCVHMTYLQLALAGIPAVIYHRNGLTLETWDRWETPAYIMQYPRFVKMSDIRKGA